MHKKLQITMIVIIVLLTVALFAYSPQQLEWRQISFEPALSNVTVGMPMPAYEEPFPEVAKLAEMGQGLKETDLNNFEYSLLESNGPTMQLAISWLNKKWEFRGSCSHTKMHIWLVLGEKSLKNENEWVLIPPATMRNVFQKVNGNYIDTRDPSVTCANLKWTIDK